MKKLKWKEIIFLHLVLLLYSFGGIFSKLAAQQKFLSLKFILFYSIVIGILFLYALLWQKVLKKMPLTIAFANKAIVIIWGIIWGWLFWKEVITFKKMVGAGIIIIGIILVVKSDE